ncbi:Nicotinate-nucleotide pyrophosphorylase-like protein [Dinothrombium tinctorium]|uniref:Nicotinate-nucleotide pyrophosphorylase [carboxylating] n=1 Tax=Dinothrombium tinctorium TaxID=1965070 RepID=A0A3S4RA93_9ACAR|nr:Nicotinate-nucleotide pyrophosphorylase-like [carboxylating] [Dinothrombium tinctorium]RWS13595.1 Nicotinate-nucleotide pyrophosphorylase-like [carboxylating] [Dinothrombium tinctorium]RWS13638.1 Nicotinate-nucleotide pyrophosphorylase-like protein [Dinothrombium tinctorium]
MNSYKNALNPVILKDLATAWLREDLPNFDLGAVLATDEEVVAKIYCKSDGVLAGIPFANAVFTELECSPNWFFNEGEDLKGSPTTEVAYVGGKARNILLAERTVLNTISRCSGVASVAKRIKTKLDAVNWKGYVAGTRKTTPGFRMVEKYGLLVGGASSHRYDLSNMIMVKDNHINLCGGSVKKAVSRVKEVAGFVNKIEVECRSHKEVVEAASAEVDIIMLDNFSPKDAKASSLWLKQHEPQILIEASGNINEDNVINYALPSIDIISMSCLVQGYKTVDFSMKILTPQ